MTGAEQGRPIRPDESVAQYLGEETPWMRGPRNFAKVALECQRYLGAYGVAMELLNRGFEADSRGDELGPAFASLSHWGSRNMSRALEALTQAVRGESLDE